MERGGWRMEDRRRREEEAKKTHRPAHKNRSEKTISTSAHLFITSFLTTGRVNTIVVAYSLVAIDAIQQSC